MACEQARILLVVGHVVDAPSFAFSINLQIQSETRQCTNLRLDHAQWLSAEALESENF